MKFCSFTLNYRKLQRREEMRIIKGIEVYQGIKILKDGSFKIKIDESEFQGQGWFNLKASNWRIKFIKYDTRNSPFHNFTSCPAHTLLKLPLKKKNFWREEEESNYFILKCRSQIEATNERIVVPAGEFTCLKVKTNFRIPPKYTGPPYLKKQYWFSEGIGIIKLEVNYRTGEKDIAVLKEYQVRGEGYWPFRIENKWVYQWDCQFGPNKFNIHNTGQEDKYKPAKP